MEWPLENKWEWGQSAAIGAEIITVGSHVLRVYDPGYAENREKTARFVLSDGPFKVSDIGIQHEDSFLVRKMKVEEFLGRWEKLKSFE